MKSRSQFLCFLIASFAASILLSGCGGVRYPARYMLKFPAAAHRVPPMRQDPLGPLEVRDFRCPAYLCDGRIVYRPSPEEVGYYEYHRWALSPRQAITRLMADSLQAQSFFTTVSVHETGINAAYVLSGSIDRLEEVDDGRDVRALCTISAQLVEVRTGSIVWQQNASETVSLEKRNMAGLVSSLSAAARVAVDRLVESMTMALASANYVEPQP